MFKSSSHLGEGYNKFKSANSPNNDFVVLICMELKSLFIAKPKIIFLKDSFDIF